MPADILNKYPSDINTPPFEHKCVKIYVKYVNIAEFTKASKDTAAEFFDKIKEKLPTDLADLSEKASSILSDLSAEVQNVDSDALFNLVTNKLYEGAKELAGPDGPSDEMRMAEIGNRINEKLNGKARKTIYTIVLPLPNELEDEQTHGFSTTEGVGSDVQKMLGSKEFGKEKSKNKISGAGIAKAMNQSLSKIGARMPLINPGYFQEYKGSEPRKFTFSWELIPNNPQEANEIRKIIYHIKKYSLPKTTAAGTIMLSPYSFQIEIGNPFINQLVNMADVVCESVNVNYASEGALQFFPDGTPKIIKLQITFAENRTLTSGIY